MTRHKLNGTLECSTCGTIRLEIPDHPDTFTQIHCATCGKPMGTWGHIKKDFALQLGHGVFEVEDGQFITP